jgi:hypothetical protein
MASPDPIKKALKKEGLRYTRQRQAVWIECVKGYSLSNYRCTGEKQYGSKIRIR